jgi:hypothetical protein
VGMVFSKIRSFVDNDFLSNEQGMVAARYPKKLDILKVYAGGLFFTSSNFYLIKRKDIALICLLLSCVS